MLLANGIIPKLPLEIKTRESKVVSSSDVRSQLLLEPRVRKVTLNDDQERLRHISKMFGKTELSVSSYDTAWVSMVPCRNSEAKPLFQECLNWVLEHQHPDGSWSPNPSHPLLLKDSLSSTLACVLALNKWKVGELLVQRGLQFIETNSWAASDSKQLTPIGFNIIFPGMVQQAIQSGLKLPLDPSLIDALLQKQDIEVKRYELQGNKGHLAYVLEGLGRKNDWKEVMKHQRIDGSILNSPAATAAALIHKHDDKCYHYISSILKEFDNAVPTIYPLDVYIQLSMIDNLQKLGIDQYFRNETESVLDGIYRRWLQGDDQIFSDVNCCALAFRLLRMSGYDVSSNALEQFSEEKHFFSSVGAQFQNSQTILELYKASQMLIYQKEPILEKIQNWTGCFLKQELLTGALKDRVHKEVDYALDYFYDGLNRLESKRNIEQHDVDGVQLLKTSYRVPSINNKDLLAFSVHDYNKCQGIYQEEFRDLERWLKDSRLDQLKFARQKLGYCYYSNAAVANSPELSEVRISMTKNCVMATVIDDFFDCGGSMEELENLIKLLERWEGNSDIGYCSEEVEILFVALQNMINDLSSLASPRHGRNITPHLVKIWLDLLKSMMKEAEWTQENAMPTLDEYMEHASISFAMGPIVLIPVFSAGPALSEEVVTSAEYDSLFMHLSLVGRLLNDLASVKRESAQGKPNSVSIRVLHGQGAITEEEAVAETKGLIESYRRELQRLVLETNESVVPRACKDLFWGMSLVLHNFYKTKDGYSCPLEKVKDEKAVLWEPLTLSHLYVN